MESTVDCPVTERLRRTVPEATSYTKTVVVAVFTVWLIATMPTMKLPSGVTMRRPGKAVAGRPTNTAGSGVTVVIGGGAGTEVICKPLSWRGS